jgi:hypothetical protein
MSVPQANLSSNLSAECDPSSTLPVRRKESDRLLAPIALFVYNRPEHTRRTVEALRANGLAQQSDLFVFADGAKNNSEAAAVGAVREYIRAIDGFRSVRISERKENLGLSKSIISGVTQLCEEFGRVIVVEDDVMTAPDFLSFVNQALDRYANEPAILSVCGFNYPIAVPKSYPYDAFFSYRFACWGWGTWKDRWEKADWSVKDFPEFVADRGKQKRFNRGGDDLSWMLRLHMQGKIDSWDTVWAYTHTKYDAFSLLPVTSKAYNIGLDGSGIHCKGVPFRQNVLRPEVNFAYHFAEAVNVDADFAAEIQRFHRRSTARRLVRFLRRFEPRVKRLATAKNPKAKA